MSQQTSQHNQLVEEFVEFYGRYYQEEVLELANGFPQDQKSLWVEASDLCAHNPDLLDDFLNYPERIRSAAEDALVAFDLPVDIDLSGAHVRLTDSESYTPELRVPQVASEHIGKYVGITGQIEKVTGIDSRLRTAVWVCQRCGQETEIPQPRTSIQEPYQCESCDKQGPFQLAQTKSRFTDQRKVKLKEPPGDRGRGNGRSITVYVDDDLCSYGGENGLADRAGERATIYGTVNIDESQVEERNADPDFDHWQEADAIEFVDDDYEDIDIQEHKEEFTEYALGEEGNPVELVKNSIAPQLIATDETFDMVLEAAVAWLFNAYRVDPAGRGQFRGDLHMCIIGDPGLGKSTLMSQLAKIAPKSEFRSGTGLSKVGMTAAAKQEEFAGKSEWTLSPGILPRANGGHCIIDEVDDVVDDQTKAIHDALEGDQMVKVDKAGISANLPTRTALLASGNPKDSRFDPYTNDLSSQIDMDPALLDRMDLIFALQDSVDVEADQKKANHIVDSYDELSRAQAYQSGDETVDEAPAEEKTERPVPVEVLRAWILYGREEVNPLLTPEAKAELKEFYIEVRDLNGAHASEDSDAEAVPATPRTLEAGIRIATAFARVELSDRVTKEHAMRAKRISRKVVGLNFDPDSGEFDSDRVGSGTTKSQKDRRSTLVKVLEEMQDERDGHVPQGALISHLEDSKGYEKDKLRNDIEKLKEKGELYEPENSCLKTIR